jgi:hypothetical protein
LTECPLYAVVATHATPTPGHGSRDTLRVFFRAARVEWSPSYGVRRSVTGV